MSIEFSNMSDLSVLKDGDVISQAIKKLNAPIENLKGKASCSSITLKGDNLNFLVEIDLSLATLREFFAKEEA